MKRTEFVTEMSKIKGMNYKKVKQGGQCCYGYYPRGAVER